MAKAKPTDLLPLPAIRIAVNSCKTELIPMVHQISALPNESDLEYYFVPSEFMELFRPYYRPGKPFKNLKLINFGRPAISLTFYNKHKYHINRGLSQETALNLLQEQRDILFAKSFFDQMTVAQQKRLQEIDGLIRSIRQEPDNYEFCTSNYHHYYRYWYCSFRYFEDDERTQTGTANEHMLKHTQRTDERSIEQLVSERLNIIFIDMKYISRPVSYDNKLIDRELENYPVSVNIGKSALYVRQVT